MWSPYGHPYKCGCYSSSLYSSSMNCYGASLNGTRR